MTLRLVSYPCTRPLLTLSSFLQPVQDVLDCLIVFKVQGIQKGITWVHEHAHVTFPRLPVDTFSLGASSSIGSDASGSESFLSSPDAVASDQITDVVMKLTGKWEKMLYEEAVISGCIVAIWGICVLIALIRTMVLFNGKDKNRGEGGSMPAAFYPGDPSAQPQQRTMYTGESSAGGSWGQRNNTAAVNPFPMFNSSPSDTCTPKTPMEFSSPSSQGSEKEEVRVGVVRGGMNSLETGRNRDSIYPTTDYKR